MTELPARASRSNLRPSDRDRENVAEVLREAAADGRIDFAELDERLSAAYAAKSYGALDTLTGDLPAPGGSDAAGAARVRGASAKGDLRGGGEGAGRANRFAVALFSGFVRRGPWRVPRSLTALCLWGGGVLDLSEAVLTGNEVRVSAYVFWGGMKIVVPEDADVRIGGLGLLGLFGRRANGPGAEGGPRVAVRGLAVWGAVITKRAR